MAMFSKLMISQDWRYLLLMILVLLPCLMISWLFSRVCSEVSYILGDPSGRLNGFSGCDPRIFIEPVGYLLFVTTGLGWAKPLPLKRENFKRPFWDSFLVLLAGMFSCFCLGGLLFFLSGFLLPMAEEGGIYAYLQWFLLCFALLSLSFSFFQCLPLPFFGLFHVITAVFSEECQIKLQKFQGQIILLFAVLLWTGYAQDFLANCLGFVLKPLCLWSGVPFSLIEYYFL